MCGTNNGKWNKQKKKVLILTRQRCLCLTYVCICAKFLSIQSNHSYERFQLHCLHWLNVDRVFRIDCFYMRKSRSYRDFQKIAGREAFRARCKQTPPEIFLLSCPDSNFLLFLYLSFLAIHAFVLFSITKLLALAVKIILPFVWLQYWIMINMSSVVSILVRNEISLPDHNLPLVYMMPFCYYQPFSSSHVCPCKSNYCHAYEWCQIKFIVMNFRRPQKPACDVGAHRAWTALNSRIVKKNTAVTHSSFTSNADSFVCN